MNDPIEWARQHADQIIGISPALPCLKNPCDQPAHAGVALYEPGHDVWLVYPMCSKHLEAHMQDRNRKRG